MKWKASCNFQRGRHRRSRREVVLCVMGAMVFCAAALAVDPPPDGGYPNQNTAEGENALFSVTAAGNSDTAIGFEALYNNTSGGLNTALGYIALLDNTTGGANTAVGGDALNHNTTGNWNVAVGQAAMAVNTTGGANVAIGSDALEANTNGFGNVAIGFDAMAFSQTASYNTAVGNVALAFNSAGIDNTAIGDGAMNQSSGSNNVAAGRAAGLNFAGDTNIAIGHYAGQNVTTGSNNILIGNQGSSGDANKILIGTPGTQTATYIAGIRGVALGGMQPIGVNGQGQLGVRSSSARFKEAIKPMGEQSEAILALRPVSFRYKKELDPNGDAQFGLVAEDVAKVTPELVVRDEQGKPLSVRYEEVNAMLLNEFLKEHRKVDSLEKAMAEQQKENAAMRAMLKEQATQIQKVSAQLAAIQPCDRLVTNE